LKISLIKNAEELKQIVVGVEKDLLAKAMECARKTFGNLLEQIDLLIQKHKPQDLVVVHKRSIWYRTWLGQVRVTRRQYRGSDGKYRYPLDELMGMARYNHTTFAVKEIACRLAAEMPFRRSAEVLSRTTSIDLSYRTIHRLIHRVLINSQDESDRETAWFEETGELKHSEGKVAKRLMIEADGVMLPLQRETARKAEIKLGIVYEGWQKVGKDRYSTVNKTYYADMVDTDRFWSAMTLKLHQKYDLSRTQHVIGGDGAAWIKEGVAYFGGQYQLCRYHLNRALYHALGHDHATLRSVQHHCNRNDLDAALKQLQEAANVALDEKAKEIKRVIKYIRSNSHGLQDYRDNLEHPDSDLRRTGAIEGNIDKLIVRRMKNQGMSWSRQGIRNMLRLRISIREGTFTNYLLSCPGQGDHSKMPGKQINKVIDRAVKYDYTDYFNVRLPAIYGPHASREWVEVLKSLTRIAV
jgi:hypothetical protein